MERGSSLDDAVAEMQARGIAEADPSHDIDGWDAAAKTAALVNVLMGGAITPHDVTRSGIRDISRREVGRRVGAGPAHPAGRVGLTTRRPARGPGRTRDARSGRSAGGAGTCGKRLVSSHRPAGRRWYRPAQELADANRVRATERPLAHQPTAARALVNAAGSNPATTVFADDRHRHRAITQREQRRRTRARLRRRPDAEIMPARERNSFTCSQGRQPVPQ